MTTSLSNHKSETQLTAAETTIVDTNSSEVKFIGKFTLTNTSTSNIEVTLWRILTATTGTTGSGGNWIWRETIPAGKAVTVDKLQGHVLGNSMKISGLAGTASVINVDVSGTTET
jgi:hypothetical protein